MDAKRTVKTDVKYKDILVKDNKVWDFETGEEINLVGNLYEIYGEEPFTLTCSTKIEEVLELESSDFD